jgi:hypothetical protein
MTNYEIAFMIYIVTGSGLVGVLVLQGISYLLFGVDLISTAAILILSRKYRYVYNLRDYGIHIDNLTKWMQDYIPDTDIFCDDKICLLKNVNEREDTLGWYVHGNIRFKTNEELVAFKLTYKG